MRRKKNSPLLWFWYDLKRLKRLIWPEQSVKTFIEIVGPWWLWWYGCRREYKIKLHRGWFCPDFAFPKLKLIIEADGFVHNRLIVKRHDVARDFKLMELGWTVWRVTVHDMKNPPKVRRDVRRFIRGHYIT